jgi:hypothetical protein
MYVIYLLLYHIFDAINYTRYLISADDIKNCRAIEPLKDCHLLHHDISSTQRQGNANYRKLKKGNKKFWEELIAYFPFIRYGSHGKRRV